MAAACSTVEDQENKRVLPPRINPPYHIWSGAPPQETVPKLGLRALAQGLSPGLGRKAVGTSIDTIGVPGRRNSTSDLGSKRSELPVHRGNGSRADVDVRPPIFSIPHTAAGQWTTPIRMRTADMHRPAENRRSLAVHPHHQETWPGPDPGHIRSAFAPIALRVAHPFSSWPCLSRPSTTLTRGARKGPPMSDWRPG
jgi:hypothetical protein